jgi:hypothetical protein
MFLCLWGGVMGDEISKKGLSVFGCFFMGVGERMKWLRSSQEQENKRKLLQVPREGKIKCYFSHQNNVILPKWGNFRVFKLILRVCLLFYFGP